MVAPWLRPVVVAKQVTAKPKKYAAVSGANSSGRDRLLDEHRFRSLGKLVVGNLDRIADVDNIGD